MLDGNNGLTKQAGISLRMVNCKYFLKNAALTAIHAHISLWNGFGHLPEKYSKTKYKITVTVTPNNILIFNQRFRLVCSHLRIKLTIAPI
jgi:hypothetical protein